MNIFLHHHRRVARTWYKTGRTDTGTWKESAGISILFYLEHEGVMTAEERVDDSTGCDSASLDLE